VKNEKTNISEEAQTETETEIGVAIVGQEVGTESAADHAQTPKAEVEEIIEEIEEIETGMIGKSGTARYRSCILMRYLSRIDLTSFQRQLIERFM